MLSVAKTQPSIRLCLSNLRSKVVWTFRNFTLSLVPCTFACFNLLIDDFLSIDRLRTVIVERCLERILILPWGKEKVFYHGSIYCEENIIGLCPRGEKGNYQNESASSYKWVLAIEIVPGNWAARRFTSLRACLIWTNVNFQASGFVNSQSLADDTVHKAHYQSQHCTDSRRRRSQQDKSR